MRSTRRSPFHGDNPLRQDRYPLDALKPRREQGQQQEIEAEAVAYLVASRAGVVPASAQYIKGYATRSDMTKV